MKECNICALYQCNKIMSAWPTLRTSHKVYSAEQMGRPCASYIKLEPLKTTIFQRLLAKQPGEVVSLLRIMGMKFIEVHQPPFFTFDW